MHISIIIIARALYPMQVVFNMCAHVQPRVASIKRGYPEYWYIQALYAALMRLDNDLDNRASGSTRSRRSLNRARRRVILDNHWDHQLWGGLKGYLLPPPLSQN